MTRLLDRCVSGQYQLVAFFDKKWIVFKFRVAGAVGFDYLAHAVPDFFALNALTGIFLAQ